MSTTGSSDRKLVSIICPVYNEEQCLPIFYDRASQVAAGLKDRYDFEMIFVNNRSEDRTLEILLGLRKKDPRVQILTMSRNFGYQASVQAGLTHASGDAMVVIDVDCEDPPELIPTFIEKWEEGFDVVYGSRENRPENWIIKKGRNVFYHLLRITADMDIVLYMAEFSLVTATVRDAIISNYNAFNYLRAEIGYAGFARYGVPYTRQARVAGRTHYNVFHMVTVGVAAILTSSTFLLRLPVYIFPFLALFNAAALMLSRREPVYFMALVAADLVYMSLLLTAHGAYLARIYKNGIRRPLFILDARHTHLSKHVSLSHARSHHV
jgi:dolichol-phosphate mannosyltransferase